MRRASWKESWWPLAWSRENRKQIQGLQKQAQRLKSVSTELFQNLPEE